MAVLDEGHALVVAGSFLDARSTPAAGRVEAAYRALEVESDQLFRTLTAGRPRHRIRVGFTDCLTPYDSDAEMIHAVRSTRVLEVVSSRTDHDRRHPFFSNRAGDSYDRLRAVHDLIGHVGQYAGFDRQGEFVAWRAQARCHTELARHALATELHAEHSVRWTTGVLPDHKATLLDARIVARAERGKAGA